MQRVEVFDAHPVEAEYSDAEVVETDAPLEHDAHEVLAYARALAEVVLVVERFTKHERERSAVLGFMTGSEPLDWLLRRRLGHLFEGRIRHVRGLRHKSGGADPDAELYAQLDAWMDHGVSRIVVIDEVVEGSQMRTAFLRLLKWHGERGTPPLAVHLVAVTERAPEEVADREAWLSDKVLKGDDKSMSATIALSFDVVRTSHLLGKDKAGQSVKDVELSRDGSYSVLRLWPGGYTIRCPNRLTLEGGAGVDVVASLASVDQLFGVFVYAVCGFGYVNADRWPETIKRAGCTECKRLLHEARKLATEVANAVPCPESVPWPGGGASGRSPRRHEVTMT
ncbi:MAG: hypothetical protein U0263_31260 [Polyangiaceae bacterium]